MFCGVGLTSSLTTSARRTKRCSVLVQSVFALLSLGAVIATAVIGHHDALGEAIRMLLAGRSDAFIAHHCEAHTTKSIPNWSWLDDQNSTAFWDWSWFDKLRLTVIPVHLIRSFVFFVVFEPTRPLIFPFAIRILRLVGNSSMLISFLPVCIKWEPGNLLGVYKVRVYWPVIIDVNFLWKIWHYVPEISKLSKFVDFRNFQNIVEFSVSLLNPHT